jgi:hypothetical protein
MSEPIIGILRVVEVIETDLLMADEEVITYHDTQQRGQEDGERAENGYERGSPIDELPWLDNPRCEECDDSAAANIDVPGEDAGQINASSNSIAAHVLEENGKRESKGQKEHSSACSGRAISI